MLKKSDPNISESNAGTTEQASANAVGMADLKQIYLVFMDEFKLKPFGQEDEERYAPNQRAVAKAINELEPLSDNIQDARTKKSTISSLVSSQNTTMPLQCWKMRSVRRTAPKKT